jgi:hypothetical protein
VSLSELPDPERTRGFGPKYGPPFARFALAVVLCGVILAGLAAIGSYGEKLYHWLTGDGAPAASGPNDGAGKKNNNPQSPITEQKPNEGSQPTVPPTAQDVAKELGAWEATLRINNQFVVAYNALDLAMSQWPERVKNDRPRLRADLSDRINEINKATNDLDALAQRYPSVAGFADALARPHSAALPRAAANFSNAIGSLPDAPLSAASGDDLRELSGAVRLAMTELVNWMTDLSRTANLKINQLSGRK